MLVLLSLVFSLSSQHSPSHPSSSFSTASSSPFFPLRGTCSPTWTSSSSELPSFVFMLGSVYNMCYTYKIDYASPQSLWLQNWDDTVAVNEAENFSKTANWVKSIKTSRHKVNRPPFLCCHDFDRSDDPANPFLILTLPWNPFSISNLLFSHTICIKILI